MCVSPIGLRSFFACVGRSSPVPASSLLRRSWSSCSATAVGMPVPDPKPRLHRRASWCRWHRCSSNSEPCETDVGIVPEASTYCRPRDRATFGRPNLLESGPNFAELWPNSAEFAVPSPIKIDPDSGGYGTSLETNGPDPPTRIVMPAALERPILAEINKFPASCQTSARQAPWRVTSGEGGEPVNLSDKCPTTAPGASLRATFNESGQICPLSCHLFANLGYISANFG